MTIFLYQLTIVVTLILTKLIAPKFLLAASLIWTALTAINVFWPPLLVGQLVVVWVTYSLLRTRDDPQHHTDSTKETVSDPRRPDSLPIITPSANKSRFLWLPFKITEPKSTPEIDRRDDPTVVSKQAETTHSQLVLRWVKGLRITLEAPPKTTRETALQDQTEPIATSPVSSRSIRPVRLLPELSEQAKLDIRNAVTHKQIGSLIHFTRASNLNSILTHGLCSVAYAEEQGIKPNINDHQRLDGFPEAISLSIVFPNDRMFYKYRQIEPSEEWVILVIDPTILWSKRVAFCQRNAAHHKIREQPLSKLMTAEAFEGMFDLLPDRPSRQDQRLRDDDPTDSQAEVLVFDSIEPDKIKGVAFDSIQVKRAHEALLGDRTCDVYKRNTGLFGARNFVR